MNHKLQSILFSGLILLAVFSLSACKHDYSADDPLPPTYSPSVFVGTNNQTVYSLDPETGAVKWKIAVDGEVHSTPFLFKNQLWVGTTTGHLYQIRALNGEILQDIVLNIPSSGGNMGGPVIGTPMPLDNNRILVPAGNALFAVKVDDYSFDWAYTTLGTGFGNIFASLAVRNIPELTSPAIFIATDKGQVEALDEDGHTQWSVHPAGAVAFHSSPCVVNDSFLYIGSDGGILYSLNTENGSTNWTFHTGGQILSSPIHIGGNVMFGCNDRTFYSVDSATGLLRWKFETSDLITSSPALDHQYVYFGSQDGYFYKIDIIDGHLVWKKPTFGLIKSSPTIYKGFIYFGSFDKNLYSIDTADGGQKWVRNVEGQMESSVIIDTLGGAIVPSISGEYKY